MSAVIETIIVCDGKQPGFEGTYANGDCRDMTAKAQRARFHDWVYRGGKDYCANCAVALGFKDTAPRPRGVKPKNAMWLPPGGGGDHKAPPRRREMR